MATFLNGRAVRGGVAALWWVFACSLVLGPLGWLSARGVST